MNINTKTQLQKDLESIQGKIDFSEEAIGLAIDRLNEAHQHFWDLPDDRLSGVLQHLHDNDELDSLFAAHSGYAVELNAIATGHTEITKQALIGRNRDFTISGNVVVLEVEEEVVLDSEP